MAEKLFADYITSADNHNLANAGFSWLDPTTWGEKIGNAGKFTAVSLLSGANSFYNTGATIGSWITGLDIKENPTDTWISSLDSDFGQYYRVNQEEADTVGFIASSLIPGLIGVKAFNIGQKALVLAESKGLIGGNLAKATGLLVPKSERFVAVAANEINSSVTAAKLLNIHTTKALISGVHQNVLEGMAFEVMVQAAMFKSPLLDDHDVGDITSNILMAGAFQGVVGGAFSAAKIFGTLKASIKEEDVFRRPLMDRPTFAEITSPYEKIIHLTYDAEYSLKPTILKSPNGTIIRNGFAVPESLTKDEFLSRAGQIDQLLYKDKLTKNFNDTRDAINTLAGSDKELGNIIANISTPILKDGMYVPGFANQYLQNFWGALKLSRINVTYQEEKLMEKAIAGGAIPDKIVASRYLTLLGDGAGKVSDELPKTPWLADLYSGKEGVLAVVRNEKFSLHQTWSARDLKGPKAYQVAEKRYIWAQHILKEIPDGSVIDVFDIPVLERAYKDNQFNIKITRGSGPTLEVVIPSSKNELLEIIKNSKQEVAYHHADRILRGRKNAISKETVNGGNDAIARIVNVKTSFLEGNLSTSEMTDLFAIQSHKSEYITNIRARGLSLSSPEAEIDPIFLPKHAKILYEESKDLKGLNGNILNAMTYLKINQKLYEENAKRVVGKIAGEHADMLPDISDRTMLTANRVGGGAGLVSSENSNYGTIGSTMAFLGNVTKSLKEKFRKSIGTEMESALVSLGQKPEAAIELESINQKVTRSGELWIRHSQDAEDFLITKRAAKAFLARESLTGKFDEKIIYGDLKLDFDSLNAAFPEDLIQIRTFEARRFIDTHIEVTGKRTSAWQEINAARGKTHNYDPATYRPIRPDLKQYPHFAFVMDESVTGSGHMTMIHAASEKELAALVDKVPPRFKVLYKQTTEEFKKARHEFEYSRSLNENYINSALKNEGVFSNFFPKSDPRKIVDDILQQHYRESDVLAIETMRLRYEPQFNALEDLGRQYSKVDTSQFASKIETLEKLADNPYFNLIKTALDVSKINEHHLIFSANKLLDEGVSRAVAAIRAPFREIKSPEQLDQINALLDKYGMKPAFYDSALQALANHTAPKGELTKFVRQANSLLSLFTLGLDPLNALNNAIGSNILRMTELKHLTKAIEAGDAEIAGQLSKIAKIKLPGVGDEILAPTKLVAKAIKNFWDDTAIGVEGVLKNSEGLIMTEVSASGKTISRTGPLTQKYKDLGLIKDRVEQLKLLVDDFTLKGTESVSDLNKKMSGAFARSKKLFEEVSLKGEKATGNKLAEEFNRFISANVMDQLTEIAVNKGLMTTKEANAYITTFVNRVEGNMIASQRPLIFQGPIGQAISLFQSYQFNLLQQLFRYIAEGSKKDIAMLAGLQSTLYGLQSLPAFQFINTHIIGQLSGNKEHRDLYDTTYGAVGRTAGDFILYGLPSNLLHTNIYSRGDINPRQLTILPTSLQEIPLVQGWGKFLSSLYDTTKKITGGANVWESILQGIEHNGISRPLAGFAQTLQAIGPEGKAYSTTGKGSILFSNDLVSLASLSRLAGGRPMDEAVVNDALYRVKTYEAARRDDLNSLAKKMKTTLIGGNEPGEDQILQFAQKYAELGGKQAGFNKWMMGLYKNATIPQAEQIKSSLTNPFSFKMQLMMGGEDE